MRYLSLLIPLLLCASCTPAYTWGYTPTIHPKATQAYIQAILAKDAGDYQTALDYYNEALDYTWSDKTAKERDELAALMH